ncbi:VOC family protein [Malonomonas rubra]|uniref:VOC family protein n=1 Tax=Malonomonas rubra TaxID=57040 RepID=UPI0026F2FA92|nr:VOC family protein [Malonomonas rubra]
MQFSLTLAVADLEQTEEFYREILQLNPQRSEAGDRMPDFLLLRCGAACIVFRPLQVMEAQHPALLQNLTRHPLGVGMQLELSCSDLSAVRNSIERYQWPVLYELEDYEHQRRELWLHDPDGYLLVLNEERGES